MIASREPSSSHRSLLALAALQVVAALLLLLLGTIAARDTISSTSLDLARRTIAAVAASIEPADLASAETARRRIGRIADGLDGIVALHQDGEVFAASGPRDDADSETDATLLRAAERSAIAETRLVGDRTTIVAAAPVPGEPAWQVSLEMPQPAAAVPPFAAIAAGGTLLATLPLTILAWSGRLRRERLERVTLAIEKASQEGRFDPDVDGGEELLPLEDAIRRFEAAWFERLDRVESSLAEQSGLLEALGSALITLDRQQRIRSLNAGAAAMLGVDREAGAGRLLQETFRSPQLHRLLARAMAGGEARPEEFPLTIGGREVVVQATCSRMGERGDLLILMTEVTRLRRLESLRSDFAANVSHELRTPITNIKGYVDTLVEVGFGDPEQSRRFLDIVRRNADRLAGIIEDLLTLAQLEWPDARQRLAPGPCDSARLVQAVAESLGPAAEARRIRLDQSLVRPISFIGNAALLEQALANLVSNAIKYAPEGTTARLRAEAEDGHIVIAVQDEGPGIPREHLERLFERFYRVDRARSRDRGGTGLGLSIVKHIAAVHEGRVEVDSEVGKGSEFRLVLPLHRDGESLRESLGAEELAALLGN